MNHSSDTPFDSDSAEPPKLVPCVVPGCKRLLVSYDPAIDLTTQGALPHSDAVVATAEYTHARERWCCRCEICDRDLPESVIASDFTFTQSPKAARARWHVAKLTLADARFEAEVNNSSRPRVLTEEEEEFLSQAQLPCAVFGCDHLFSRDDPLVDLTVRGTVPPTSRGIGEEQEHCTIPNCDRPISGLDWFDRYRDTERYADVKLQGDLLIEWVKAFTESKLRTRTSFENKDG